MRRQPPSARWPTENPLEDLPPGDWHHLAEDLWALPLDDPDEYDAGLDPRREIL